MNIPSPFEHQSSRGEARQSLVGSSFTSFPIEVGAGKPSSSTPPQKKAASSAPSAKSSPKKQAALTEGALTRARKPQKLRGSARRVQSSTSLLKRCQRWASKLWGRCAALLESQAPTRLRSPTPMKARTTGKGASAAVKPKLAQTAVHASASKAKAVKARKG